MTFLAACYLAWPLAAWIYASATGQVPWGPAGQVWVAAGAAALLAGLWHLWRAERRRPTP